MAMKRGVASAAGVCAVLAGCAGAPGVPADNRPVVRIEPAARPAVAIPLTPFLPDAPELAQTLATGPDGMLGPAVEGGAEVLLRSVGDGQATPADCVSTAYRLQQAVYGARPVLAVASNSWAGGGFDAAPVSGFFGIVQMASAGEARDFFATISEQWRRCNGQTVALQHPDPGAGELSRITGVDFGDRVVSADVLHVSAGTGAPTAMRALGVAGDCIVDVELIDPRTRGDTRGAVQVASLLLDKIDSGR